MSVKRRTFVSRLVNAVYTRTSKTKDEVVPIALNGVIPDGSAQGQTHGSRPSPGRLASMRATFQLPGAVNLTNDADVDTVRNVAQGARSAAAELPELGLAAQSLDDVLRAVLSEEPKAECKVLAPADDPLWTSHRSTSYDGEWIIDAQHSDFPFDYHQLRIANGKLIDSMDRATELQTKRQQTLWRGRRLELSKDKNILLIMSDASYFVRYHRWSQASPETREQCVKA